ncbi:H-RAS [Acrasis kona]|uniref:H-RAS n=1 Tax=Acrasis kona TaxID=1008807 RepID=A0AAW2YIN5_9EUKA
MVQVCRTFKDFFCQEEIWRKTWYNFHPFSVGIINSNFYSHYSRLRCLKPKYYPNMKNKEIRVVLFGLDQSGKSSLAIRFISDYIPSAYDSTIEDAYGKNVFLKDGLQIRLIIIDTGGSPEYSPLRDSQITTSDCFLVVYAIDNLKSFLSINEYVHDIRFHDQEQIKTSPIFIVGAKSDKINSRKVPLQEAIDFSRSIGCRHFETSAYHKDNVDDVFLEIAAEGIHNIKMRMIYDKLLTGEPFVFKEEVDPLYLSRLYSQK